MHQSKKVWRTHCSFCSLWSQIITNSAVRHSAGYQTSTKRMLLSNSKLFPSWHSTKETYLNNFKAFIFVPVNVVNTGKSMKLRKFVSNSLSRMLQLLIWSAQSIICKEKKLHRKTNNFASTIPTLHCLFWPCVQFPPAFLCWHTDQTPVLQGHRQIATSQGSQSALQLSRHQIPQRYTQILYCIFPAQYLNTEFIYTVYTICLTKCTERGRYSFLLLDPYRLHSETGCNLLIDLIQFVSKKLSVLCGHDGFNWGSQDLYPVLLQDTTLE